MSGLLTFTGGAAVAMLTSNAIVAMLHSHRIDRHRQPAVVLNQEGRLGLGEVGSRRSAGPAAAPARDTPRTRVNRACYLETTIQMRQAQRQQQQRQGMEYLMEVHQPLHLIMTMTSGLHR